MRVHLPLLVASLATVAQAVASDVLIKPGLHLAVIDTPHIHALVPADEAELLKPLVARAEVIYVAMARDAGYTIRRPLDLLLTDDLDDHNGFSFVTPFPLVNVQLAPALQPSFIYTGNGVFERTLTHELTHHFSNDREPNAFRRTLENIFGRILPNDLLSLVVAYLSTPAHQTMPSFWHEGCAQWAESSYAPADSAWRGRGHDSLSHMVWRLDAAAGTIPPVGDWHLTYQRWPFGTEVYLYGLAYLRYLDGAYGDRANVWQLIEAQEHRWPFCFDGGARGPLGKPHAVLLAEARDALLAEQQAQLRVIRGQPVTVSKRLTGVDTVVGAPAWTADGRLFAALNGPYALPGYVIVDALGRQESAGYTAYAMSSARSLANGSLVFSETPAGTYYYARTRVSLVSPRGRRVELPATRLVQPDARVIGETITGYTHHLQYQIAAIHLLPAGRQELSVNDVSLTDGWLFANADCAPGEILPSQGIPWSPTFRPGHDELTWVETDASGSRLVLAPLIQGNPQPARPGQGAGAPTATTLGARSVLAQVPGRILHPAWSAKGDYLFFCADHSGVANAYRVDPAKPGELVPVTNTIGGITACVPSPDGIELAVIDYDHRGPYLARIANDPSAWPKEIPKLALPWPAPVTAQAGQPTAPAAPIQANAVPRESVAPAPPASGGDAAATLTPAHDPAAAAPADHRFHASLPADPGDPAALAATPYRGLTELRPLFWTPTTAVVPEGGYGVTGFAADPILSHEFIGAAGVGPTQGSPVGFAGYVYGGWPIDVAVIGWQAERAFSDQIVDATGKEYDYVEDRRSAEARLGLGIGGFKRRFQLYAAGGIAEYRAVHSAEKKYAGQTLINLPAFTGVERYSEVTLAYDDSTFFPTSYAPEDGSSFAVIYRHSGYNGDLDGDRIIGMGSYVLSFWPEYGQQLVFGGAVGWSNGDRYLQGQFSIGGPFGINQVPRGYYSTQAIGDYLVGGSIAYRTPVWRPFHGYSTTPFVDRQTVLELFFDGAKVSSDHLNGNGEWFRSVGAELHVDLTVWEVILNPGIGVAYQLDGDKKFAFLFNLGFHW